ncbi:hypothetical protein OsJ_13861 [Oryza sativa Japonica Group]|uniref:Uncharacterized protein n=1 Tax=Oryza sativa subsp. japonica TaxID=39947 RepID=B9FDU2_ORYSJ|nr:hypothetical protein OsJ_13861 [Oryza sativa Japonica Group]
MVVRTAEEERVDSVKNPAHECTTVRGRESARRKCVGDAGERGGKSETQDGGCGVISPFQVRGGEEGERTVAHGAGDDSPPTSSSNTVTWPFVLHVHRALAAIHKNNIAAPNLWHPIDTYDRVALAHRG